MCIEKIKEKVVRYKKHNICIQLLYYKEIDNYSIVVLDMSADCSVLEEYKELSLKDSEFYFQKFLKKYSKNIEKIYKNEKVQKFIYDYNEIYNKCKDNYCELVKRQNLNIYTFNMIKVYLGKRTKKKYLDIYNKNVGLKYFTENGWVYLNLPFEENKEIQCEFMKNYFIAKGYKVELLGI